MTSYELWLCAEEFPDGYLLTLHEGYNILGPTLE